MKRILSFGLALLFASHAAALPVGPGNSYGVVKSGAAFSGTPTGNIDMGTYLLGFAQGSAAAPGLYPTGDANTGFYRIGADNIGLATNGVLRFDVNSTGTATFANALSVTGITYIANGTAATPSLSFNSDNDGSGTGWFRSGANAPALSINGTARASWTSSGAASFTTSDSSTVLTLAPASGVSIISIPNAGRIFSTNTRLGLGLSATAQISVLDPTETIISSFRADGTIINNTGTTITINDDLAVTGSLKMSVTSATTTTYTMLAANFQILCDSSANSVTVALQAAATAGAGRIVHIKNIDNTNGCFINPDGSETVDNSSTTFSVGALSNVTLISDGSEWWIQ